MAFAVSARTSDVANMILGKQNMDQAQSDVSEARNRTSSGLLSRSYASSATAPNTRNILKATQNKIELTEKESPMIVVKETLNTTISSIKDLRDIATELAALSVKARDGATKDLTFRDFCIGKLAQVESILNTTNSTGAPIFGGTSRDGKVVDLSLVGTPAPGASTAAALTTYFKGTSGGLETSFDENQAVNYGCSADADAIRDLIFWLKKGAAVVPDGIEDSNASIALITMVDGVPANVRSLSQLTAVQGNILGVFDNIEKRNGDKLSDADIQYNSLNMANVAEEIIRSGTSDFNLQMNQINKTNELRSIRDFLNRM